MNGIEGWTGFDPSRIPGVLYPNEVLDFVQKEEQVCSQHCVLLEVNEVLTRELAEDGYSGVEVRVNPMKTVLSFTLRRLPREISVSDSLHYKLLGGLTVRRA